MKFLCNIFDPRHPDAFAHINVRVGQTRQQAWNKYQEWLKDKYIGEPVVLGEMSVEELLAANVVGVYALDD